MPPETPAPALGEMLRRLAEQAPGPDVDLQETSAVWPGRYPHPAAARFAAVARDVLETRPGRPERIVGPPALRRGGREGGHR